jgi:hypothetical protein
MNDYDDEQDYELEEEHEVQDVIGVCNTIRVAWKLTPRLTLSEFFDVALPTSFTEMTDRELIEALEEFIHQNQ